jgi:hypothetical protein
MAKSKPGRSQASTAMAMRRAALVSAETSSTSSSPRPANVGAERKPDHAGEKVAVPSPEMFGSNFNHIYKILKAIGILLPIIYFLFAVVWECLDIYRSVRSHGEDIKTLQHKAEDLFRSNATTEARVSLLERTEFNKAQEKTGAPPHK